MDVVTLGAALSIMKKMPDTAASSAAAAEDAADRAEEAARTLTTDSTLSESGQAADAKKTGDEISELKSAFNQCFEPDNYFNPNTVKSNYRIAASGGEIADTGYFASDYIAVEVGKTYTKNSPVINTYHRFAIYNASKTFIRVIDNSNDAAIGEGEAYLRFSGALSELSTTTLACGFSLLLPVKTVNIVDEAVTLGKTSFLKYEKCPNLIDESTIVRGSWYFEYTTGVNFRIGTGASTAGYSCVIIPIEGLDKITIYGTESLYYYSWFTADTFPKSDVSTPYIDFSGYGSVQITDPVTIAIPHPAKYMFMSVGSASPIATIMANAGSTALPYQRYWKKYLLDGNQIAFDDPDKNTPSLIVPESYPLVVGDTFQLFYKGIIDAIDTDELLVEAECKSGSNYKRLFEITPVSSGNVALTLKLYDNAHNLLDRKNVTLAVQSKASSPVSQKNVLCVGDSLTIGGAWVGELKRRLTGSGGSPDGDNLSNIAFIGTCSVNGANFEAYGGYTFNAYNTSNVSSSVQIITTSHDKTEEEDQHSIYKDGANNTWKLETINTGSIKIILVTGNGSTFPSTGTLTWVSGGVNHSNIVYTASEQAPGNPFWDADNSEVNFAKYATSLGVSSIDYIYVLLGWNNVTMTESVYKQNAQTFIDNVKASYPNAKIVLIGLEIPSREGLGMNYGATGAYSKYYDLLQYVHTLDQWYDDLVEDNTNVFHINLSGQFDTEYNMSTTTVQVNTRNTDTVSRQSNGIHPAQSGQMQIADAAYRHITGII